MEEIDAIRATYSLNLKLGRSTIEQVAAYTGAPHQEVAAWAEAAALEGLVRVNGPEVALTASGRARLKVVMIGGAFEIIHPGHLFTVEQARKLGDTLVVVVATDKT